MSVLEKQNLRMGEIVKFRSLETRPVEVIEAPVAVIAIAIENYECGTFFSHLLKLKSVQHNGALTYRITTSHTANKHSCLTLTFISHKHSSVYVVLSCGCVLFSETCCYWCLKCWGSGGTAGALRSGG